ncbi:hypothetical protein KC131_24850 [Pseudomonas sp. JQ170]|uniref:hypothetical protein n=1 Tax=unclassified Pseudomonas TaxID=196821 RepID=UPI00265180DD|nr:MULTISPECIES: hypothetical protein [unclassified Pseudomonas]MDN7143878.1 hypothetical protein [Pseudomonas sp. JQ170]WRO74232.1 hypothetical protein U9R80_17080 [Pseudomonas sp. 170C]
MSRSGYSDDCDGWSLICWRGAVKSAIRGKRGQALLVELRDALDAMPDKRLVTDTLEADGQFCTLGALGAKRGLDMTKIDAHDRESVAQAFGIAEAMAAEIVYENDESPGELVQEADGRWKLLSDTPEQRWRRMRAWVESNIQQVQP